MTTITIDKRMLEKLYLYWLEDADPHELEDFEEQVRTTLSAPATAPEGGPAGWFKRNTRFAGSCYEWEQATAGTGTPLYLHPPAPPERKPMTDKEIAGAIVRSPDHMAFGKLPAEGWRPMVRLVEAFHGIKGDKP